MTLETQRQPRNVITLVVRLWPVGHNGNRQGFRYQATHVQTGEVVYFRNVEDFTNYLERFREHLSVGRPAVSAGRYANDPTAES